MMNAMDRRCVQHVFEPAELADRLRMHEKLKAEIDQHDGDNLLRRKAEYGERNPEHPHAGDRVHQALAEGGRKIHPLRRVMHHMRGPQPPDAVTAAMKHVVEQVLRDEQHNERHPARLPCVDAEVVKAIRINGDDREPRELVGGLLQQRERGVAQRVAPTVKARLGTRAMQVPRLPADTCKEDGCHGEQQQFGIELHGRLPPWSLTAANAAAGVVVIV